MAITDLIPWKWGGKKVPVERQLERQPERQPETALDLWQRDANRLFDEFGNWFGLGSELYRTPFRWLDETMAGFLPRVDVSEDENQVQVAVELPGVDEKDLHVSLSHDVLTIRGEKKEEREQKGKNYYRMERSYGSFERSIPLPAGVDGSKVDATFKQGVLTITLPKVASKKESKKITIKAK